MFPPFSQALNAALFYNNPDPRSYVSLVPTSAHTGDGMGDLISQVVQLTQTRLAQRLSYSEDMESMVLEVSDLTIDWKSPKPRVLGVEGDQTHVFMIFADRRLSPDERFTFRDNCKAV